MDVTQFDSESAITVIEDRAKTLGGSAIARVFVNVLNASELRQTDPAYGMLFPRAEQRLLGTNLDNSQKYRFASLLSHAAIRAGDFEAAGRLLLFRRELVDSRDPEEPWSFRIYDVIISFSAGQILREIAQEYADLGDLETAIETLESARLLEETPPTQTRLDCADLRIRAGDFEGAIEDAESALKKARRDDQSRTKAAIALLTASLAAGRDGLEAREQIRSALESEDTFLADHGSNYMEAAFLLKETDPVFASELFEDGRRIEEISVRDFPSLLLDLSSSCRRFGSQSCWSDLAARAENELSSDDDFLFDYVGEAYAAIGDYESAFRWASKRTSSAPPIPIFAAIVRDAVERGDEVSAAHWLQKWAEDVTPFAPWTIHGWGAPEDRYAYLAAGYALLSKLHFAEGRKDAAKQYAISAFMLALEGSAWRSGANELVSGGLGASLGIALGALAAAER